MSSTYQATAAVASPGAASDKPEEQRYTRSLHGWTGKVTAAGCSGRGLVREQQGMAVVAAAGYETGHSEALRRRRSGDGTGPSG